MITIALSLLATNQLSSQSVFQKSESSVYTVSTNSKTGTGFIIHDGNYLLTCEHVVEKNSKVEISSDGNLCNIGYLVKSDPNKDLALFALETRNHSYLSFADSFPATGEEIFAIGSSLGFLERTLSKGIISSKRRVDDLTMIQFDAPVSPGNSGGPLLNKEGKVVGVVLSQAKDGQNLNFAISTDDVLRFYPPAKSNYPIVGNYGQVKVATSIFKEPSSSAETFCQVNKKQYLVLKSFSRDWTAVLMTKGVTGYIPSKHVQMLPDKVKLRAPLGPSFTSSEQLLSAVEMLKTTSYPSTTLTRQWSSNCLKYAEQIFQALGREISNDIDIQKRVGTIFKSSDELLAGDRIYFNLGDNLKRVAVYLGEDKYTSITKTGIPIISEFDSEAEAQVSFFVRTEN